MSGNEDEEPIAEAPPGGFDFGGSSSSDDSGSDSGGSSSSSGGSSGSSDPAESGDRGSDNPFGPGEIPDPDPVDESEGSSSSAGSSGSSDPDVEEVTNRVRARERGAEILSERVEGDVDPSEVDVSDLEETDEGLEFDARLESSEVVERAAGQSDSLDPSDLEIVETDSGRELRRTSSSAPDPLPVAGLGASREARTNLIEGPLRDAAQEQAAREQAVDALESNISESTGLPEQAVDFLDLERGEDVELEETESGVRASLSEEQERQRARGILEGQLEEETGVDLDPEEDIRVEETGDGFRAELTEQGESRVEVENTPLSDSPLGGATTTGTRARREIRDRTDPIAEGFRDVTPSQEDVGGLLGASAAVAVAEPTPIGEGIVGTGLLVGGAAVAGGAAASAARGQDPSPTAETGELDVSGEVDSELDVGEGTGSVEEISVPEGSEQRIAPEELGVPREDLQEGELPISGPEGTDISEDGEIIIPAQATQVARGNRFEDEEEEEEEEDEEDEEDEESREDFLDRVSPDETVVIGEPEGSSESEESESESEQQEESESLLPEQEEGVDDSEPDESQSDEGFESDLIAPGQGVGVDDSDPESTRSEEEFDRDLLEGDVDDLLDPETDSTEDSSGTIAGPGGSTGGLLLGPDEEQETTPELSEELEQGSDSALETPATGELDEDATGELEGSLEGDQTATGELEGVGESTGLVENETPAETTTPELIQETTTPELVEEPTTPELVEPTTPGFPSTPGTPGTPGSPGTPRGRPRLRLPDSGDVELLSSTEPERERSSSRVDRELSSGFLNEFTAQLAGVDRSAPSQSTLEDVASERVTTESLPVEGELESSEEFDVAADFLSGGFELGFGDRDSDGGLI